MSVKNITRDEFFPSPPDDLVLGAVLKAFRQLALVADSADEHQFLKTFNFRVFMQRANGTRTRLKIPETLSFCPREEDQCLQLYLDRLEEILIDKFVIQIDNLQFFEPMLIQHAKYKIKDKFMLDVAPMAKEPLGSHGVDCTFFAGRYQASIFGPHLDPNHNFFFSLRGSKTLRGWWPEFVQAHPEMILSKDYEPFRQGSVTYDVDLQNGVYWPPEFCHLVEGPHGKVHSSLGVGYFPYG